MELKKETKKNQVVLTMVFDKKEWEDATELAYKKNAGKYKLAGFRAGKAPRKMIEQQYGEGIFMDDAVQELFSSNFDKDIKLIDYPHLDFDFTKEGGIKLVATCDIEPEVKLGKYKGLEIKKTEVKVAEKDVEEYLKRMQSTRAKQISADKDYKLANGDIAVIDFKGSVNGEYFEGGEAKNHQLEIGSHSFIDNFEEQLIGLTIGQEKDIMVTFPKEYHAENLKGQKAKFEIKVNNILKKELPEINDVFAKEISEFETLKDLKSDLKKKMTEQATKQAEFADEEKLFNAIADAAEVEIPDVMIQRHLDEMMNDMAQKLSMQGATIEMYAQYMNTTVEKMREEQKEIAKKQVKLRLVIDAIIQKEKLLDKDRHKQFENLTIFLKRENKIC